MKQISAFDRSNSPGMSKAVKFYNFAKVGLVGVTLGGTHSPQLPNYQWNINSCFGLSKNEKVNRLAQSFTTCGFVSI